MNHVARIRANVRNLVEHEEGPKLAAIGRGAVALATLAGIAFGLSFATYLGTGWRLTLVPAVLALVIEAVSVATAKMVEGAFRTQPRLVRWRHHFPG